MNRVAQVRLDFWIFKYKENSLLFCMVHWQPSLRSSEKALFKLFVLKILFDVHLHISDNTFEQ